ncbi:MAG: genetic competence negative regulator [Thermicanus sp.]|nr:genetic competence negative regulator [Thermicanus sp.]
MRIERLTSDKVRFFLTFDDLMERNIDKDDLWKDLPKVHELFNDMMEQAYYEVGFEVNGPVAVEVFALPSQGMMVIITRGRTPANPSEEMEDVQDPDTFELEVMLEEREDLVFAFRDFEDLIRAAHRVHHLVVEGGKLFFYKGMYILYFDHLDLEEGNLQLLISILAEYGEILPVTEAVLSEYGKLILANDAVKELILRFQ